jgi:general secretion pathway protein L
VALPLPSHRKRLEALPFAIEDRIATPTDSVHLALADDPIDGLYLTNIVDRGVMAAWIAKAAAAGLGEAAIMPDALALALPTPGRWTVMRQPGTRILVRMPDGRGFAVAEPNFLPLWTAAGKPECDEVRQFPDHVPLAIDLRQGAYAVEQGSLAAPLRRLATVAAAGLLAHGAIAAADIVVLQSIAAKRGLELQSRLLRTAPGVYAGMDPAEAARLAVDMLPAGPASPPGTIVPLLAKTSAALGSLGNAFSYRAISFSDKDGLRIDLDAPDATALERARRALANAGLTARTEGSMLLVDTAGLRS